MPEFDSDLPPLRETDEAKPGSRDYAIIEWCEDRLKQGQLFLQSQVGFDRIDRAIDAVFAYDRDSGASYIPTPKPLSRTRANMIGKTAEDITAYLTDTKVFWNYNTANPKYQNQARISNKRAEHWYTTRMIDLRWGDGIRYYTAAGTGFLHLYYSRQLDDQMVEAEDPRNVIPIEPLSYHTVQDSLGVIIRRARTPGWVKAEFGKTVDPDVGGETWFGWLTRTLKNVGGKVSGPLSRRNKTEDKPIPAVPTVFVNTMYLRDNRTNKTGDTVYMGKWEDGEPQNSWSYKVPPGAPLYPFNRMIVWGGGALLYDGPAPYWHAKFPLIKLTLNPWPGSWLGKAPLWDVIPLNESMNSILQVIDDHAAQVAQPGAVADRNVARSEFDKFNTRVAGYKIRTNLASGKGIMIQQPPPLDQSLWQHINWIDEKIKVLAGTADMSQVAQLNQLPSDDTIDTIMKAMTPGIRLRSRILEGAVKEFAEMFLYNMAQFDTLPKRFAMFGPAGVTPEDFDYDPGSFIPDDVPDGDQGDIASTEDALGADNPRPRYQRAKQMLQSFVFSIKPGSLLNSAAQQQNMEDLMLAKMGYLSVFTLMENLGRMNFAPAEVQVGTGPDGKPIKVPFVVPTDELGRLQLQQTLGIGMIANAQGRKATDQAPPQLSQDGGGDVTLQTS